MLRDGRAELCDPVFTYHTGTLHNTNYKLGGDPFWLQGLKCNGSENSLLDCNYTNIIETGCDSDDPVVVMCDRELFISVYCASNLHLEQ